MKTRKWLGVRAGCITLVLALVPAAAGPADEAVTPRPLVDTYDSLANAILAAKKTEWNVVHSILATTYGHAQAALAEAKGKLSAGQDAGEAIERLAAFVAQIGNEGDASVAAIRKRLLEGGHHHHAGGEEQGIYDEGFVIVTREAKKVFLDAGKSIAKLGGSASVGALEAEWKRVEQQFAKLHP